MNIEKIKEHYQHAKQKHPYFCDMLTDMSELEAGKHLTFAREILKYRISNGLVRFYDVMQCEFHEMQYAMAKKDVQGAIEKCYNMIAVALRTIDVLECRQALGDPEKDGARVWCVKRPLHRCVDCEMCPPAEIEEIIAAHREEVAEGDAK